MPKSQPPPEGPAKDADSVEPGSVDRFRKLALRLLNVDQDEFKKAREKDERERRAKRRERS
jgi:hypothetical protein